MFFREMRASKERDKETIRRRAEEAEKRRKRSADGPIINFRGIPWGTNLETVLNSDAKLFENHSFEEMTFAYDFNNFLGGYSWFFVINPIEKRSSRRNPGIIVLVKPKDFYVAKEPVSFVKLYFSYIPENGKLIRNKKNTALYAAEYYFVVKESFLIGTTFCDTNTDVDTFIPNNKIDKEVHEFSEKIFNYYYPRLASIYGPSDASSSLEYSPTYHWYGKDNTELILNHGFSDKTTFSCDNKYKERSYKIRIAYIWRKGNQLLSDAINAIEEVEPELKEKDIEPTKEKEVKISKEDVEGL